MARALLDDDIFPIRELDLNLPIPPDLEAVYHLRALTVDAVRLITQQHTRTALNPHTRQMDVLIDQTAVNDGMLDYAIVTWDGVTNGSDPAPCDLAHKKKLPVLVQRAIVDRAQIGRVPPEVRAASFRESA